MNASPLTEVVLRLSESAACGGCLPEADGDESLAEHPGLVTRPSLLPPPTFQADPFEA